MLIICKHFKKSKNTITWTFLNTFEDPNFFTFQNLFLVIVQKLCWLSPKYGNVTSYKMLALFDDLHVFYGLTTLENPKFHSFLLYKNPELFLWSLNWTLTKSLRLFQIYITFEDPNVSIIPKIVQICNCLNTKLLFINLKFRIVLKVLAFIPILLSRMF